MPLTSVVMTVYNNAPFLAQAIAGALSQSMDDLEMVLVDDGSTDESLSICQTFARQDARVRLFAQANGGFGGVPACNRAVTEAKGEFISRCDADDIWLPHKLRDQLGFMSRNPRYLATFSHAACIDASGEACAPPFQGCFRGSGEGRDLAHRLLMGNFLCHSAAIYRRSAAQRVGLYSTRFFRSTDHDLWLRLASVGDLAVLNTVSTLYRIHTTNVSFLDHATAMNDSFQVIVRNIPRIHQRHPIPPDIQYRVYLTAGWAASESQNWRAALRLLATAEQIAPLQEAALKLRGECLQGLQGRNQPAAGGHPSFRPENGQR